MRLFVIIMTLSLFFYGTSGLLQSAWECLAAGSVNNVLHLAKRDGTQNGMDYKDRGN